MEVRILLNLFEDERVNTTVVEFVQSLYIQLAEIFSLAHFYVTIFRQHGRASIFTEVEPATYKFICVINVPGSAQLSDVRMSMPEMRTYCP